MESISEKSGSGPDLKKSNRKKENHLDRLPPHLIEAEQGVLGCILLSPNECIGECVEKLKIGSEVFYDLKHRVIYETLVAMYDQRQEIDAITLHSWLKDNQELDQVGGVDYIAKLQDSTPSSANLSYYIEIIKEKFLLRKYIQICTDTIGRIYDYEGDIESLSCEIERELMSVRPSDGGEIKKAKDLIHESISQIEQLWDRKGSIGGISTGFPDLDKMTDGLHPGDVIVLSGYEKSGKTAISMNIVESVILESKLPVAVFSLEMTAESLITRMLCSNARVNLFNVRDGFMSDSDFPRLTGAAGRLSSAHLYVDDSSDLTISQLRAKARRLVQQFGIKMFVVDYAQLVSSPGSRKGETREQEVSAVSKGIKAMAKELRVPVILLSQLNDDGKLRESRSLGQDADAVWKLKPVEENKDDPESADAEALPMILRIDRQRHGGTGNIPLTFLRGITRFESAARTTVSEEDVPDNREPYADR